MSDWDFDPVIVNDISYTPVGWANAHLGSPIGTRPPRRAACINPEGQVIFNGASRFDWNEDRKRFTSKFLTIRFRREAFQI